MTQPVNPFTPGTFSYNQWYATHFVGPAPGNNPVGGISWSDIGTITHPSNTPQPPASAEPWIEKPGSYYFENVNHAQTFETFRGQRKAQLPSPTQWDEQREMKLVNQLNQDWFDEPWQGNMNWEYEELEVDRLETIPLRKYDLRPFKINYDTAQEIKLRLNNTVISVKGHPYLVKSIRTVPGDYRLALYDGTKTFQVKYSDLQDLRSIPPMYVTYSGPGWLCRIPGRVYQQGMNRHNTIIKTVDGEANAASVSHELLVAALRNRPKRVWDSTILSLLLNAELNSIRLSDEVAVKTAKGKILACYRGRKLGVITDNEVKVFDEDDLLQQWIEKPIRDVGLELRA